MSNLKYSSDNKASFARENLIFDKEKFEITVAESHNSNTLFVLVKNIKNSERYNFVLSDATEILNTNKLSHHMGPDFNIISYIEEHIKIIKNRFLFLTAFIMRKTAYLSFNNSDIALSDKQLIVQTKFKLSFNKKNGKIKNSILIIAKFNNKRYTGSDLDVINSIINDFVASKLERTLSEITLNDSILLDICDYV